MKQTVVGVFDRYESARHAATLLEDSGFGPDAVHVTDATSEDAALAPEHRDRGVMDSIRSFFAELFGSDGDADRDMSEYAEAVRRGGAVVKVDVEDEPKVDTARQVLQSAGAVNIDERVAEWREQGWSGTMSEDEFDRPREDGALGTHAAAGSSTVASDAGTIGMPVSSEPGTARSATRSETSMGERSLDAGREEVIPVVKEELEVGKRAVSSGGVRVYAHTVERPVQETLDLREEHAKVERRPVDRPASAADLDAFKDRTLEVREMAETPVVKKTARVVEEVVVGKKASQRQETVRDTVRNTEVEVDPLDKTRGAMLSSDDDLTAGYRSDWQRNYGTLGGTYDHYEPAYRYGHTLAGDTRYSGRRWEDIEPDVRSDWERQHPGSAWERFKAAVRHGWERVTD
jgi:uncharacterized protein (TIGR02271 family)